MNERDDLEDRLCDLAMEEYFDPENYRCKALEEITGTWSILTLCDKECAEKYHNKECPIKRMYKKFNDKYKD